MVRGLAVVAIALASGMACRDRPAPGAASDAGVGASGLQVVVVAPRVGERRLEHEESESTMTIDGRQVTEREVRRVDLEVLAVDGEAASRLRVRYQRHERTPAGGDAAATTPTPLHGQTYEVWRDEGGLRATRAGGEPASAGELALLADDHAELGSVPVIVRLIAGRRWHKSRRVDLRADQLAALGRARGGGDPALRPRTGWLAWTVLDGGVATFDGEMQVVRDDGAMAITSTVRSTLDLAVATGRVRAVITSGTVTGQLAGEGEGAEPRSLRGSLLSRLTVTDPDQ
jgi:hypothetical protein